MIPPVAAPAPLSARLVGGVLLLIGLGIGLGGGWLLMLGGSAYYLIGGAAVALAGWQAWRAQVTAAKIYAGFLLATLLWSLWEVGLDGWQLMPRMIGPALFGLAFLLPGLRRAMGRWALAPALAGLSMIAVTLAAGLGAGADDGSAATLAVQQIATPGRDGEWAAFGRTVTDWERRRCFEQY